MSRPRRSTVEAFYDVFSDMPLEDQAAALRILEQVHRLEVRAEAKRKAAASAPAQPAEDDDRDEAKGRELFQEERCPPRE